MENDKKSLWKSLKELSEKFINLVCDVLRELNRHAKFHGISHIVNTRLHPLERILWLSLVSAAFYIIFRIGYSQVTRYIDKPTVISIDRDYRRWNGTIPGLTFCYHNRFDHAKAQDLIDHLWNVKSDEPEYNYFLDFIKLVSNTTISEFKLFNRYTNDRRFEFLDMSIVARDVHPNVDMVVSGFAPTVAVNIEQVLTEQGICYSVNSIFQSRLFGTHVKVQSSGSELTDDSTPLTCYYHLFNCMMKLEVNDPTIRYTIHSPYDVVTAESVFTEIGPTEELEHTYTVAETTADEKIKSLSFHQRKCLFYDETFMDGIVGYNVNFCRLKCRAEAALQLCNCRPHFYKFISGPSCSPTGLICLSINSWPRNVKCSKCPRTCPDHIYVSYTMKRTNWADEDDKKQKGGRFTPSGGRKRTNKDYPELEELKDEQPRKKEIPSDWKDDDDEEKSVDGDDMEEPEDEQQDEENNDDDEPDDEEKAEDEEAVDEDEKGSNEDEDEEDDEEDDDDLEEEEEVEQKKSILKYVVLQEKHRFHRSILFSSEDLLVSLGALASFFIGYNFLNTAKMVHFILITIVEFFVRKIVR